MNNILSTDTRVGTAAGTLLAIMCSIDMESLFKSCVFAATGAAVSFTVSVFCKWVWRKIRRRSAES